MYDIGEWDRGWGGHVQLERELVDLLEATSRAQTLLIGSNWF